MPNAHSPAERPWTSLRDIAPALDAIPVCGVRGSWSIAKTGVSQAAAVVPRDPFSDPNTDEHTTKPCRPVGTPDHRQGSSDRASPGLRAAGESDFFTPA